MTTHHLWSYIRADLREFFAREHLRISITWYAVGLITWTAAYWLDDRSYWEGILQSVALLYVNVVGLYAIAVALVALPVMRMARSFGVDSERPSRLALHASGRFRHVFELGAIAIGVLSAQLTVAFWTMDSLNWIHGLQLAWILVALSILAWFNAFTWSAARALDVKQFDSPALRAIQSLHPAIYAVCWIVCIAIVVTVVLVN